jgi:signal transduction histidine kinase
MYRGAASRLGSRQPRISCAGGARADHGTGLLGLEDRVAAVGGHLMIESPPGSGTRVRALLPLLDPG